MAAETSDPSPGARSSFSTEVSEGFIWRQTARGRGRARDRNAPLDDGPPPDRLGRFIVLGTLGRGGMGTVLEAYDPSLDRKIALKVLHATIAEDHAQRLVREAKALAKLSHPNVVQVYEVGETDGRTFIAMEMVRGETLRKWQSTQPRPGWHACVEVYLQAGRGLAAAHAAGLVHRDFKPDNCIIDDQGRVRVLDFGLVRETDRPEPDASEPDASASEAELRSSMDEDSRRSLTQTGAILGTIAYMSRQQFDGLPADAASDQFSFCVSLWEALHGERPFDDRGVAHLIAALTDGEIRSPPRSSRVPAKLRRTLIRGLAADPEQRHGSMDSLLAQLQRLLAPRARWWIGGSVLVGSLAIGGGLIANHYLDRQERCSGARAQLDGIWDDAQRRAVERAILATELPYAPATWARVEPRLDDYAAQWVDRYTDVCEATSVRHEQSPEVMDLRMTCLRQRKVALRESVGVLAQADETRVERAVDLVAGLPALSRCDDLEALRAALPPPEDPQVAAEVARGRERLATVDSLHAAGAYEAAMVEIDEVIRHAKALEYEPLLAEAMLLRGRLGIDLSRPSHAKQDLERAYRLAVRHSHDEVEVDAASNLIYVTGRMHLDYEAARRWREEAWDRSLRPGTTARSRSWVLNNIGILLAMQGENEAAKEHFDKALAVKMESLGPEHPDVGRSLCNLGRLESLAHHHEDSLDYFTRAQEIFERQQGPLHPLVDQTILGIAQALATQGKSAEALELLEQSLPSREAQLGQHDPRLIPFLRAIGIAQINEGAYEDALEHLQRALAIDEGLEDSLASSRGELLNYLGLALASLERYEDASEQYRRSVAILEREGRAESRAVAYALMALAEISIILRDPAAGREDAERALAIFESNSSNPIKIAEARFVLARTLWSDPAERERARTLATHARQTYADAGAGPDIIEIDRWLHEHPTKSPRADEQPR